MTLLCFLAILAASSDDDEPIRVRVEVARGVHYVGEGIALAVGAVAEGERPAIVAPKVAGVEIAPTGTELKRLSASGIGDFVEEQNLFVYRYRVCGHRAGLIEVPPFRVRLGERSGASPPVRLTVRALPVEGRPAEFLGGVGPFEVSAEARPATVRTGRDLEYRLSVTGPASRGMSAAPDLARFARVPLGLEIEPLAEEFVADPPARVFRYRLRPTRAGSATLPPVAVAAFDPRSARYVTKAAPGVPVRVVDVPRFDPARVNYPPPSSPASSGSILLAGLSAAALVTSALMLLAARWHRARREPAARARRLAAHLARTLPDATDAATLARDVTDGLAAYLRCAVAAPAVPAGSALTPDEARRFLNQALGRPDLSERAGDLIAACDRARFAGQGPPAEALRREARRLFEALGKGKVKREERWEKPREAVGTA